MSTPRSMSVISESSFGILLGAQLEHPLVDLPSHGIELLVATVSQPQHTHLYVAETVLRQGRHSQLFPEGLHIVRGVSLARSGQNEEQYLWLDQSVHGEGVTGHTLVGHFEEVQVVGEFFGQFLGGACLGGVEDANRLLHDTVQ